MRPCSIRERDSLSKQNLRRPNASSCVRELLGIDTSEVLNGAALKLVEIGWRMFLGKNFLLNFLFGLSLKSRPGNGVGKQDSIRPLGVFQDGSIGSG